MQRFEYKVIPAPSQGEKARGARSTEDRLALALASAINAEARQGWDYVRSETLPTEERSGLTKRRTVYVNLLVFRRPAEPGQSATAEVGTADKPLLSLRAMTGLGRAAPKILPVPEGAAPKLGPATGDAAPGSDGDQG